MTRTYERTSFQTLDEVIADLEEQAADTDYEPQEGEHLLNPEQHAMLEKITQPGATEADFDSAEMVLSDLEGDYDIDITNAIDWLDDNRDAARNRLAEMTPTLIASLKELSEWMREHTGPSDGTRDMLVRAAEVLRALGEAP